MSSVSREMVTTTFEGALPDIAEMIASDFKIERREILHNLQGWFRTFRERAAERASRRAEALPALIADPGD